MDCSSLLGDRGLLRTVDRDRHLVFEHVISNFGLSRLSLLQRTWNEYLQSKLDGMTPRMKSVGVGLQYFGEAKQKD